MTFVDPKRKYPMMGAPEGFELLYDRERVPKRPRMDSATTFSRGKVEISGCCRHIQKLRSKPHEQFAIVNGQLSEKEEREHYWGDLVKLNPINRCLSRILAVLQTHTTFRLHHLVRKRRRRVTQLLVSIDTTQTTRLTIPPSPLRRPTHLQMTVMVHSFYPINGSLRATMWEGDRTLVDVWDTKYLRQTMTLLGDLDRLEVEFGYIYGCHHARQSTFLLDWDLQMAPTQYAHLIKPRLTADKFVPVNGITGASRSPIPNLRELSSAEVVVGSPETPASVPVASSPMCLPPQPQPHAIMIPNGFHVPAVNGYPTLLDGSPIQWMANIQSVFAALAGQVFIVSTNGRHLPPRPGPYMCHVMLVRASTRLWVICDEPEATIAMEFAPIAFTLCQRRGPCRRVDGLMLARVSLTALLLFLRAPSANGVWGGVAMMA
ncbi:hypothetical protein JAAARDRAFT_200038 [Jaapia argillacea MUCL 33604]|uniref:Uncharacterized protein n=1 Tax=Jaapia argillacea MUCL 33604 TaxID=933084 RepID=A0A067P6E7_9AGAM|nr:hypothetical protein JAAARDRAFT_200038 [Jaapia argillacea MUCL 33604]